MSEAAFTDSTTAQASPCRDLAPGLGQFEEDDVAQRVLRVVGDADGQACRRLRRATHSCDRPCTSDLRGRSCDGLLGRDDGLGRRATGQAMSALPLRTNGGLTTRAASCLSRTDDLHLVADGHARGQARQRDRAVRASGESVPLVISPSPCARAHRLVARAARRPCPASTQAERAARAAACAASAALPTKSRAAREVDGPGQAGLQRRHASRPCPGRRGSCRPPGAACRARRGRRARTPAATSAFQSSALRAAGQHDLEAVLAGVAGAGDEPARRTPPP